MNEFAYNAELGGLNYRITTMALSVDGYGDKLPRLLLAIVAALGKVKEVSQQRFDSILDGYQRAMEGMKVRRLLPEESLLGSPDETRETRTDGLPWGL